MGDKRGGRIGQIVCMKTKLVFAVVVLMQGSREFSLTAWNFLEAVGKPAEKKLALAK